MARTQQALRLLRSAISSSGSECSQLQQVRPMGGGGGGILPDERGVRVGLKHALHGHFAPVHGPTPPHGTEYITYKGMTLRKPPDSQMYIGRWLGFCTWFFFMYMFYNKGRDRLYPGHKNLLDADLAHEPSIYDPKDADEEYYIEYAQKNGIQLPAKGEHEAEHGRH